MVIIGKRAGQLGNRLFVFAHIIANAIEYNYEVQNPSFYGYTHYFTGTRDDFFCRFPSRKTRFTSPAMQALFFRFINKGLLPLSIFKWLFSFLNISFLDMVQGKDFEECYDMTNPDYVKLAVSKQRVVIKDAWFFRDFTNIKKHSAVLRSYFAPVEHHASAIAKLITTAREECDILIGVHIRQGDYKRWQGGRYFFTTAEYAAVMSRFAAVMTGKRITFLVCSNEKQDESAFASLPYIMGNNHPVEDMYAFAQCDFLIGPPSTYTSWASFYGSVPLYSLRTATDNIDLAKFHISNG